MIPFLATQQPFVLQRWKRTTFRQLGYSESTLEELIANHPDVLGLDPYETGVGAKMVSFRQQTLSTPTGRTVTPDIVFLSETGHIVVVEVKLEDNRELAGRSVIAQLVEYAASIANLSDEELLEWFRVTPGLSWNGFVKTQFGTHVPSQPLATALRKRMREAELHLVIACDGVPDGLQDFVRAVAGQAALGDFKIHVVELVPYTIAGSGGILILPHTNVKTEIVSRTAITINYASSQQPSVSVVASSASEVEKAIADVRTARVPSAHFVATIEAFEALTKEWHTKGKAQHYRQICPSGWPAAIHYEFLDNSRGKGIIGVELHVEQDGYEPITQILPDLAKKVGATFDETWSRKRGRIILTVDPNEPQHLAQSMLNFIKQTKEEIDKLLMAPKS